MQLSGLLQGLVIVGSTATTVLGAPTITVHLNATFGAPSFVVEAVETASLLTPVFPLLTLLTSNHNNNFNTNTTTHSPNVLASIQAIPPFSNDPISAKLLSLSLAAHVAAPRINAHFNFYNNVVNQNYPENNEVASKRDCASWVAFNSKKYCKLDLDALEQTVYSETSFSETEDDEPLSLDHVYSFSDSAPRAILYADLTSTDFKLFHLTLSKWADAGHIQYVLRYKPSSFSEKEASKTGTLDPLFLSGYGVELAIKSSEYKVIDDRATSQKVHDDATVPKEDAILNEQSDEEASLFDFGADQEASMQSLSAEDIKEIGVKAASIILAAESPIEALIQISQDFPKLSHLIAKRQVTSSMRQEIRKNQRTIVAAGTNAVLLNGVQLNLKELNVFSLLSAMRNELALIQSLKTLSLSSTQAIQILTLPPSANSKSSSDLGWGDAFDVRDPSVVWWNDLEKDARYKKLPNSFTELLQPSYPGQLKYIARNIFHVLFVFDLTNIEHLMIQLDVFKYIEHSVPLRFGVLPLIGDGKENSGALLAARAFLHIIKAHGRKEAKEFIVQLHGLIKTNLNHQDPVDSAKLVGIAFEKVVSKGFLELMQKHEDAEVLVSYKKLLNRLGLLGDVGAVFMNGKYIDLDEGWQQNMLAPYPKMLQFLQLKVYEGKVSEKDNLYDVFMTQPNVHQRRNPYIYASEEHPLKFVDFLAPNVDQTVLRDMPYLSERDAPIMSIQVIADFESASGLQLAVSALEFASNSPNSRIAFLHNPSTNKITTLQTRTPLHKAVHLLVKQGKAQGAASLLVDAIKALGKGDFDFAGEGKLFDQSVVDSMDGNGKFEVWAAKAKIFVKKVVGFEAGESGVVVNGRVVGPFESPARFTEEDFELLAVNEYRDRVERIDDALNGMELSGVEDRESWTPDALMKISSTISASQSGSKLDSGDAASKNRAVTDWGENLYSLTVGDVAEASLRFTVVLDPLSETAQKISSMLKVLSKIPGVSIKLLLNPVPMLEDLPIKRFYRYVFQEEVHYDSQGKRVAAQAQFKNIPTEPLLTLGLDVPRAWVVRAVDSVHDLDNLKLDALKPGQNVDAIFQLNNILVEGHARELHSSTPPRGAQFILGTPSKPHIVDTITMTNLGYLQLKANPGVWQLRLREGRSNQVYQIDSVPDKYMGKGGESKGDGYATVVVDSFEGVTIYPVVKKRVGMEAEDVLEPVDNVPVTSPSSAAKTKKDPVGAVWDQLKSRVWGDSKKGVQTTASNVTINIFSVASGHLYERFMGIMMLSVMRNTKSPVKFWLIENFLSPKFMSFVPHLAKEYGFEYEFITYNWPHWLRATTRKERTIWAYKILFLDVLFPVGLDKVIFVDADQVVRTDMKELVELDLEGAVYGYTPMGDSRPEMEGFRFWKTGYWANHLQGRPYHISALYVIDLKRFRQLLAGDRLRQQYQMLSSDPNSLANLDQDLPNNMIHEIPIFSLPKDWLWCETWCADNELRTAKTIDLCNNPLTKEPKLKRAKRIIKEWTELDNEVQAVADRVEAEAAKTIGQKRHDEL